MGCRWGFLLAMVLAVLDLMIFGALCEEIDKHAVVVKGKGSKRKCTNGDECTIASFHCCDGVISNYFQADLFEDLFPKRNNLMCYAPHFYEYDSFIRASSLFQPNGFGTTGTQAQKMMELAAFFAIAGFQTNFGSFVSLEGISAWGLCRKEELSPMQESLCSKGWDAKYPCAPGEKYFGRGLFPFRGSHLYGLVGDGIQENLLEHPDLLSSNATLAFKAAIYLWMTRLDQRTPSPHDVILRLWKPTKNDTKNLRVPGFGAAMNLLHGRELCNQGEENERMKLCIQYYISYLNVMGADSNIAGEWSNITCGGQQLFPGSFSFEQLVSFH